METTAITNQVPLSDAEYEAIVDQNLTQIKLMQKKMDDDQREIETLRAETDSILANIMQTFKAA